MRFLYSFLNHEAHEEKQKNSYFVCFVAFVVKF